MKCKKCNREAKMYWSNDQQTSGRSETFYRDMCADCYEKETGKEVLPMAEMLHRLNEKRKVTKK